MINRAACLKAHAKSHSCEPAGQGVLCPIPCWPCCTEDGALACGVCGAPTGPQSPSAVNSSLKTAQPPKSCFISWCQTWQQPGVQEGECWNYCGKYAQQWWLQFFQEQTMGSESSTVIKWLCRGIIHTFSLQVIGTLGTFIRDLNLS